jgi:hypothetical protein
MTRETVFDGHIMGASFASGDRLVVGRWPVSPFGGFADLMWARPDGRRILLAPTEGVRGFVAGHYAFDELRVTPVRVTRRGDVIDVHADEVRLTMTLRPRGPASWALALRPRAIRSRRAWVAVEDAVFRPVLGPALFGTSGVRTRGITMGGARERYAIHDFRETDAVATVDGRDLGAVAPCPPAGFGFSEFPSKSALVRVTSIFEDRAIAG